MQNSQCRSMTYWGYPTCSEQYCYGTVYTEDGEMDLDATMMQAAIPTKLKRDIHGRNPISLDSWRFFFLQKEEKWRTLAFQLWDFCMALFLPFVDQLFAQQVGVRYLSLAPPMMKAALATKSGKCSAIPMGWRRGQSPLCLWTKKIPVLAGFLQLGTPFQ